MKFQAVRGTRDIFSPLADEFTALEAVARQQARLWGFNEIRMPTFEEAGLFTKTVGETSDIVEHEMYAFTDRARP
ncbi:MAG: histidine--tRNA ligase, partial [Elusimicrobiota bacterium]